MTTIRELSLLTFAHKDETLEACRGFDIVTERNYERMDLFGYLNQNTTPVQSTYW